MHGYQAEGAAPLVHGAPVEAPETVASAIRIGNPARWEDAMSAFTVLARRGARGVRRRDPRRLLAAGRARGRVLRAGLGGVGGRAAQVRRRGPGGVRAHRPRAEGPADRDEPGQLGGARASPTSRASRRPCSGEPAPGGARAGLVREPRARATTCSRPRSRSSSSWRSRRPARSRSRATSPGVPLDRDNLCVRAFERLHPADGVSFSIRSEIPPAAGPRLERRGDRGRAVRGRPHVRAGRAAVRAGRASSRGTPTTSPRRCWAAS